MTLTHREILTRYKKIAVVGISPNPNRPSHYVSEYMIRQGYEVSGVNPGQTEVLGRPCYASLKQVPGELEIVNVFRASEYLAEIVQESIELKAKALWIQLGIHDRVAEELARKAGLAVVTDHCIMVEHRAMSGN